MTERLRAWLGVAAMATVAGLLHHLGAVGLIAWAPRPYDERLVPWLLALLVVGHGALTLTPAHQRLTVMGALSAIAWWLVCPAIVVGGAAWAWLYHRLLWSRAPRAVALAWPIATLLAVLAAADAAHFPGLVGRHPALWIIATTFALGWFLRALALWHEARSGLPRPAALDVIVAFGLAPFALVPPYMLALPKLATVQDGVRALAPATVRSGVRWLAYGLAVSTSLWVLGRLDLDPQAHLIDALRARAWAEAVPLALVVYPIRAVYEACGAGALVLGLVRCFGIAMAPAFDRPLLARDITDWWRRYNTHFRGLLVDLFWTPVALKLRRRPILAGYLGAAAVFLAGSVPLHWPKQAALHGSPWTFPWSTAAESAIMTVLVGTALAVARRRRRPRAVGALEPHRPGQDGLRAALVRWGQRAATWAMVCGAVLMIGYQVDYRVRVAPWERLAARAAAITDRAEAAALVPAAQAAVAERPFATDRRAVLARLLLATGEVRGALAELATASRFATRPALARARASPRGRAAALPRFERTP